MISLESTDYLVEYKGAHFSFRYPKGGQIIEITRLDKGDLVRLTGLVTGKKVNIDIQRMSDVQDAKTEIEKLNKVDRIIFENDYVAPHEVKVGLLPGWRMIYRFIDGGVDKGYLDTVLFDTTNGVYRIITLADKEIYNSVRMIFDLLLQSFVYTG